MKLTTVAVEYVGTDKARTPIYSANRFKKLVGDMHCGKIKREHLELYIAQCRLQELSPATIRNSLKDIVLLVEHKTGTRLTHSKVKVPRPVPQPAPIDSIEATYEKSSPWLKAWMAVVFWTGQRFSDSLRFMANYKPGQYEKLQWVASKTDKVHTMPAPPFVVRHLNDAGDTPYLKVNDHSKWKVREALRMCCNAATVSVWLPQNLRQRCVTEWMSADSSAGKIVHGHGLSVLDHYVVHETLLDNAAPKVRVPDCFLTAEEKESRNSQREELIKLFDAKTKESQNVIMHVARSA